MNKRNSIIYMLISFIYLLENLFLLIFCIWTSKVFKIIFIISFILLLFSNIYTFIFLFFIIDFDYGYKCKKLGENLLNTSYLIILFYIYFSVFAITANSSIYSEFLKNCPFTLSDLDYHLHIKRKCELYGINRNSRYKYNYICSYNAYKDFNGEKTDDGLDKIICIPAKKIEIVNNFINEYKEKTNYYCSRIDKPKKNEFIKSEYCNVKIDIPFMFYISGYIIIISSIYHLVLYMQILNDLNSINYYQNQRPRQLNDDLNCSTSYDESNSNNVSFNNEKEKNYFVENKSIIPTEVNIKNFVEMQEENKNMENNKNSNKDDISA